MSDFLLEEQNRFETEIWVDEFNEGTVTYMRLKNFIYQSHLRLLARLREKVEKEVNKLEGHADHWKVAAVLSLLAEPE